MCQAPGRTHSRILASPDRVHQVWAELEVAQANNRCLLRWVLHVSTNTGRSFTAVTVAQGPPLGEQNEFRFELIAFTDGGSRVLGVLNESFGHWTSSTVAIYDFRTRAVLTRNVNDRVEKLAPDDCPVYGDPIGLVSSDSVAVVVGSDDVNDLTRCLPEAQWELNVRTGELRRLAAGSRVMTAGVLLDRPGTR